MIPAAPRLVPRGRHRRRNAMKAWLIPDRSLSIDRWPWCDVWMTVGERAARYLVVDTATVREALDI